jgi:hypothetical protein
MSRTTKTTVLDGQRQEGAQPSPQKVTPPMVNDSPCPNVPGVSLSALGRYIDELGLKEEEQDQRIDRIESLLGWTPVQRGESLISDDASPRGMHQ